VNSKQLAARRFAQSDLVEVRKAPGKGLGGRGVFARVPIASGTVIECVPVILIPKNQVFGTSEAARQARRLTWYVFDWNDKNGLAHVALALGYGSLYNHSYEPNADYWLEEPDAMFFEAIQDIEAGQEITVNYNCDSDRLADVGFPVA
jgi:SET domain-containing protein